MNDKTDEKEPEAVAVKKTEDGAGKKKSIEIGGPKGPEPTRYGDWERKGIVSDF